MKDFYGLIIIIMLLGLAAEVYFLGETATKFICGARRRFWSTRQYSWTGEY